MRHKRNAATTRFQVPSPASAGPSRHGVNAEPKRSGHPVDPGPTTSVRGVSRRRRWWEAQHHSPQPKEAAIARTAGSRTVIPGAAFMCRHFQRAAVSTLPTCSISGPSGPSGVSLVISSACAIRVRSLVIRIALSTFTTNGLSSSSQVGNIRSPFQSCPSSSSSTLSSPNQCGNLPRNCTRTPSSFPSPCRSTFGRDFPLDSASSASHAKLRPLGSAVHRLADN